MSPSRSGSSPAQRISVRTASSASPRDGRRVVAADLPRPILLLTALSMNLSPAGHSSMKTVVDRHCDNSLQFAQRHFLDPVVFAFLQDQIGARPGRQDVFAQIDEIDAVPDVGCGFGRLAIRKPCETVEIGLRIGESSAAKR